MALLYQPQGYRDTLHHHVAISVRWCGCTRADDEDATLSPQQYRIHRQRLQSIRYRSRTFDDFLGSITFLVTMFKMRAPGLKLRYMSAFPWAILVTIFMMLYAFPSFLAAVVLLYVDRAFGTVYFSSIQGGALLWDNVFWFFGHPEVYIVLFPAIGIIADIIPTFARRPLYGSKYVIGSMIAAAIISFIVWGHHMFVTGIGLTSTKLYTVTTIAVSLPFDVIVISLIETLGFAKLRLKAPALFARVAGANGRGGWMSEGGRAAV